MNKQFLLSLSLLISVSCKNNEQKETDIKDELKPIIEKQIIAEKLKCELSFVKIHKDDLSIFCLPVDKTDTRMADQLRIEITALVSDWSASKNYKFNRIRTRFTDEISVPIKK